MLLEGIYAYLSADAGMQSILGLPSARSDKRTGLYAFDVAGQPTLPYVVFVEDGGDFVYSLAGQNRLQGQRVRFTCYGSTGLNAKRLARQLRVSLNNIPVGAMAAGSVEAHGQFYRGQVDNSEPEGHNTIYSTTVEFDFWFIDTDSEA